MNVPCSIFHNPFPRALRGIWVRVPRQAHLERQMLCLHIPCGMPVSCGRSLSWNQPCGYRRRTIPAGHSPAPVPIRSLWTCSQILFPANGCTGRLTNPHLLNLLSLLFVPFPPQRCDAISSWPHLLSKTKSRPCDRLFGTSCQLGAKLICICPIIQDNLS